MEVEWDEQKRHTNIAKHGVDFVAAPEYSTDRFSRLRIAAATTAR
jgi:uncharacterized DUF497 family protein